MNKNTSSLWVLIVFLAGLAVSAYAAPLPSAAQNLESLTKKVFPSVVRVEARDGIAYVGSYDRYRGDRGSGASRVGALGGDYARS